MSEEFDIEENKDLLRENVLYYKKKLSGKYIKY